MTECQDCISDLALFVDEDNGIVRPVIRHHPTCPWLRRRVEEAS